MYLAVFSVLYLFTLGVRLGKSGALTYFTQTHGFSKRFYNTDDQYDIYEIKINYNT